MLSTRPRHFYIQRVLLFFKFKTILTDNTLKSSTYVMQIRSLWVIPEIVCIKGGRVYVDISGQLFWHWEEFTHVAGIVGDNIMYLLAKTVLWRHRSVVSAIFSALCEPWNASKATINNWHWYSVKVCPVIARNEHILLFVHVSRVSDMWSALEICVETLTPVHSVNCGSNLVVTCDLDVVNTLTAQQHWNL